MNDTVVKVDFGGAPFPRIADLQESIWDAIMQYEGEVPTMAVVGVLRLVEHRLLTGIHTADE